MSTAVRGSDDRVFGPRMTALGRVITALVAMTPLVGWGFVFMAMNWPVDSMDPEFAGSMAGLWYFGVQSVFGLVGGIALALNRVRIGIGFLLASAVLFAAVFFL